MPGIYAGWTHDHDGNWVQTIPGKGWNAILPLYGPLEPWLNRTWGPGEIERQP